MYKLHFIALKLSIQSASSYPRATAVEVKMRTINRTHDNYHLFLFSPKRSFDKIDEDETHTGTL